MFPAGSQPPAGAGRPRGRTRATTTQPTPTTCPSCRTIPEDLAADDGARPTIRARTSTTRAPTTLRATHDHPFYITTPIYYVNDVPHLGHAYTTIVADALARFHRMRGDDTRFLTGTDEHGQKIEETAKKRGPDAAAARRSGRAAVRRDAGRRSASTTTDFIRTTEPKHKRVVATLWKRIREHNPDDLYLASYQGWYCVGCEAFYTESQLVKDGDALGVRDPQDAGRLDRQGALAGSSGSRKYAEPLLAPHRGAPRVHPARRVPQRDRRRS